MIAEADRRRCAIIVALDVAFALGPLRPLMRCVAAWLVLHARLRGLLGAGTLRARLSLAIAFARFLAALRTFPLMLARLRTCGARLIGGSLRRALAWRLDRLRMLLAILVARLAGAIRAPRCAVAAEPAAASSFATA